MKKRFFTNLHLLILILALLITPNVVFAVPAEINGGPVTGNSWSQGWSQSGTTKDKYEVFIFNETGASVDFELPGADNFEDFNTNVAISGWTADIVNPDYMVLSGPATTNFQWLEYFTGDQSTQSFDLYRLHYNAGSYLFAQVNSWDGTSWGFGSIVTPPEFNRQRTSVPEPSTLLLLGVGLVGLAGFRRKFRG